MSTRGARPIRLFLYGTLLDASDTAVARWLRPRLREALPATVPGRLLAIPTADGWFPALLPGGRGRVYGLCCTIDLARRDLLRLDRYEGHEYRRVATRAHTDDGLATVQLYRWHAPVPPAARPIAEGDFLNWLGRGRLRAYESPLRQW